MVPDPARPSGQVSPPSIHTPATVTGVAASRRAVAPLSGLSVDLGAVDRRRWGVLDRHRGRPPYDGAVSASAGDERAPTTGALHTARGLLSATLGVDLVALRWAGAAMVGLGVGVPLLPHNPGLPCPMRTLTGVPCPGCGMTTAVKAVLAGHVRASVGANPFGLIAVLIAVVLIVRPRWRRVSVPVLLLVASGASSWLWELHRFHWV